MKRLITFLLLFAALKVAGQTTGYLRFDTVKIMKQNGTCELYIINKTKDSLGLLTNVGGGLTRFIKSRSSGDSLFVGLDTIVMSGTDKLDSLHIYTASSPNPDTLYSYKNGDSTLVGLLQKTEVLASNGLSLNGDTAQLGQLEGDVGNPAILLNPRQIPLNGNNIRFSGDTGNVIIGDTTQAMDWRRIGRVQINSYDTTHPLLTIGPSPAANVSSIFSDDKAQLVIGLVDTPRHNLSQQNLKAGALILAHKSYFPNRTRERLGAKRYAMQSLKAYYARDTVDFQSGNPGGDLIGAYHGEHSYNQFPGYAGRTIYISDSSFGSEPHVGNSNSVYVAATRTRNNLVAGDKVYLKGWYAAYNTQLLMSNPDTIENYVHFLGGQTVIGGGTGTANIKNEYFFYPIHKPSSVNSEKWVIYDFKHPFVSDNYTYNLLGHKTGVGPGRVRPAYMLDIDGSVGIEKDSTPIITSIGSNYLLTIDTSANPGDSNRVKRILPSDLGITGSGSSAYGIDSAVIGGTPGSVLFVGSDNSLQQDNANFSYDSTNSHLYVDKLQLAASTTAEAKINLPHGSAPLTLANGDLWTTTSGLFGRINGASVQFATTQFPFGNDNTTLWAGVSTNISSTTSSKYTFGGASSVQVKTGIGAGNNNTLTANTNYGQLIIANGGITEAASGTHALITGQTIKRLTVTDGSASVTNTALLYLEGAMTPTVTGKNYVLWADEGLSRFDTTLELNNIPTGLTTDLILVKRTDSLVGTIAASSFTTPAQVGVQISDSLDALPNNIQSLNSQTGPNQTLGAGTWMGIVSGSNNHTYSVNTTLVRADIDSRVKDSTGYYTATVITSDATPTDMFFFTVPTGQLTTVIAQCNAIRTADAEGGYVGYKSNNLIKHSGGGISTSTVRNILADEYTAGASALSTATFTIQADGTTGGKITFTGEAGTGIKCQCRIQLNYVNAGL